MHDGQTGSVTVKDEELDALWKKYKTKGDNATRELLLLRYVPLVKGIVGRMMPKYSGYNEYDDLVNCGVIGLIDAVEKYNPNVGVKFETYATTRIRGEIIDHMREQDWAPSSLRKRINDISEAHERLEYEMGRPPSDEEVAKSLGITLPQVQKAMAKTHAFNVVNFEDAVSSAYAGGTDIPAEEREMPEAALMDKEMKNALVSVISELPEKEKLVISLYYYEELMLKEIAEVLGVSESRVSQIHSKVLEKLKVKLKELF